MSYSVGNADTLNNQQPSYYLSGQLQPPVTKNANYNATDNVILCQAGAAGFTVTLPNTSITAGKVYYIKKISGAGNITINVTGGVQIDGGAAYPLSTLYSNVQVVWDGTQYWVI